MGNMKDSGVEWFGEIPNNWQCKKMKYICSFNRGYCFQNEDFGNENDIKFVSTNNFEGNVIDFDSCPTTCKKLANKFILNNGDFLYTVTGSIGKTLFAEKISEKMFYHYNLCKVIPVGENDKKYISWLLQSSGIKSQMDEKTSKSVIAMIAVETINNLYGLMPPLTEQQLIAEFLDDKVGKIDDILSDLRKQVETLQKYKKSVITKAVTKGLNPDAAMKDSGIDWIGEIPKHWNCKKLKYVLNNPLMYGANESGEDFDENYPRYIRITDIDEDNKLKEDGKLSLLPEIAKPYILKDGDILFARSGATVGKTYLYKKEYGVAAFAGYLIKADINEELSLPEYVYFSTLGVGYDNWKNSVFTQATIQNIGADKYSTYIIPIPTLDEQKDIVNYLRDKCFKIDELIKDKKAQIEKMEKYKKSLIYEYVTGKKRVKGAE